MREVRLRVGQRSKENSGDSRRVTGISSIQERDRRTMALCKSKSVRSCGEGKGCGCPKSKISLS